MSSPTFSIPEWWGRQIARYGLWAVGKSQLVIENRPKESRLIAVDWHSYNMIALATIRLHFEWNTYAFVPPGMVGSTMTGWLVESGLNIVPLPEDGTGNPIAAMKTMVKALDSGGTPIIAVDGPHGPAWQVRPGALWLARLSGAPMFPVGIAASPAVRFPRWDQHLIPLLGSRIAVVFGEPIQIERREEITDDHLLRVSDALNVGERRAREIVSSML